MSCHEVPRAVFTCGAEACRSSSLGMRFESMSWSARLPCWAQVFASKTLRSHCAVGLLWSLLPGRAQDAFRVTKLILTSLELRNFFVNHVAIDGRDRCFFVPKAGDGGELVRACGWQTWGRSDRSARKVLRRGGSSSTIAAPHSGKESKCEQRADHRST